MSTDTRRGFAVTRSLKGHRAYGYVRISDDDEGQALGVARQGEDIATLADVLGVRLLHVFSDNDISASTLSKKRRPNYEAMLDGVRSGEASVILAYSNSRLTRRPRELEDLIDLHQSTKVVIQTVVSGDDDLSTADGRMVARIKANVDAAEAERTSERVKRQKQQRLQSGLPLGSRYRTFGFTRDWKVLSSEAAIVREVFQRIGEGHSVNSVTRNLVSRGVQTTSGSRWKFQATTRIVESPIYSGKLVYKGEIVGRARVEAIVSEAQFEAAQNRQSRPAWNTRRHLLSGIATCDVCKTAMNYSDRSYACSRMLGGCGNVKMKAEWLDEVVDAYMGAMMTFRHFALKDAPSEAPSADRDHVAELDIRIKEAQQAHTNGDLDLADLLPMLKDLRIQRTAALKSQAKAVQAEARPLDDYDSASVDAKRVEIAKYISAIMVRPAQRGLNKFDEHRFYALMANGDVVPGFAINVLDPRDGTFLADEGRTYAPRRYDDGTEVPDQHWKPGHRRE